MKKENRRKGFTLIEMLVVIAIIAILVAVVVPTVGSSTNKAKAATDAANLRAVLAQLNIQVMDQGGSPDELDISSIKIPDCKSFPGAAVKVLYCPSHFVYVYYVSGGSYYSVEYFAEIANGLTSTVSAAQPDTSGMTVRWYDVTVS